METFISHRRWTRLGLGSVFFLTEEVQAFVSRGRPNASDVTASKDTALKLETRFEVLQNHDSESQVRKTKVLLLIRHSLEPKSTEQCPKTSPKKKKNDGLPSSHSPPRCTRTRDANTADTLWVRAIL